MGILDNPEATVAVSPPLQLIEGCLKAVSDQATGDNRGAVLCADLLTQHVLSTVPLVTGQPAAAHTEAAAASLGQFLPIARAAVARLEASNSVLTRAWPRCCGAYWPRS
mgnify:CR=1 FL=1